MKTLMLAVASLCAAVAHAQLSNVTVPNGTNPSWKSGGTTAPGSGGAAVRPAFGVAVTPSGTASGTFAAESLAYGLHHLVIWKKNSFGNWDGTIVETGAVKPRFSPSGTYLAYHAEGTAFGRSAGVRIANGNGQVLTTLQYAPDGTYISSDYQLAWNGDSKVAYVSTTPYGNIAEIWTTDVVTGASKMVTTVYTYQITDLDNIPTALATPEYPTTGTNSQLNNNYQQNNGLWMGTRLVDGGLGLRKQPRRSADGKYFLFTLANQNGTQLMLTPDLSAFDGTSGLGERRVIRDGSLPYTRGFDWVDANTIIVSDTQGLIRFVNISALK